MLGFTEPKVNDTPERSSSNEGRQDGDLMDH